MVSKIRKLSEICISEGVCFQDELLGNRYCKLCYDGRIIECPYIGEKDKNGFYICRIRKIKKELLN
jgi:hypothetical protein